MISKKQKERNKEECKCGHTRGQHSYVESCRCLQVMSCKCKEFRKKKFANHKNQEKGGVKDGIK